ncbi:MAG: hypothetical protein JWM04_2438, partial [Verrucomicrobiales bacterium]|nr:hypothetical protein [Verrucomicrobiales bacterium]
MRLYSSLLFLQFSQIHPTSITPNILSGAACVSQRLVLVMPRRNTGSYGKTIAEMPDCDPTTCPGITIIKLFRKVGRLLANAV